MAVADCGGWPAAGAVDGLSAEVACGCGFSGCGEPFGDSGTVAGFGDWGCAVPGDGVGASLFFPIAGL